MSCYRMRGHRFIPRMGDKVSCYRMRCLFKSTRSGQGELLQDFFEGHTMLGGVFLTMFHLRQRHRILYQLTLSQIR